MLRSVIALACVTAIAVAQVNNPCAPYADCTSCVSHYLCGWCSLPVIYPGNITGTQCAGFNPNGSTPFSCNGVYSTDECVAGYVCNPYNFTCQLGAPGEGTSIAACEANCTNQGQVYQCNTTTMQCYEVPPNQPNQGSLAACEAMCAHPSTHPSTHSPEPTAQTYLCNMTTGTCDPTTPGKGSSKEVCEQTCQKGQQGWYCNHFLEQCQSLPPGIPGPSKEQCETVCNPRPNPGPPPAFLGGMWRGIEIQSLYKEGEWDMLFTETLATIVNVRDAVTVKGIPFNVQNGDNLDLWINITSGPPGSAGQVWKAIGRPANRGPETSYLTAAFGPIGGPTPQSVDQAMTAQGSKVFFLSQCVGTPECVFTMPSTGVGRREAKREKALIRGSPNPNDPCSKYFHSCAECLSHKYCGWCSDDVTYGGGTVGTQCAGFSSNPNQTNPFVCTGRYSTLNCTTGYTCNTATAQCVPDPNAGNGIPLNECQAICRPTPAPTNPIQQYVCNITDRKCYKCLQTHCPGSMPQGTCEASCVKPKPGPSALVIGVWRGLDIQNNYPVGEFEYFFNASGVAAFKDGKRLWDGTLTSYGGDLMIINVQSGPNAGATLSAIYSIADQASMYSVMTLATGTPNGAVPQDYATPMQSPPMYEQVLAKCLQTPCKFHKM